VVHDEIVVLRDDDITHAVVNHRLGHFLDDRVARYTHHIFPGEIPCLEIDI
jgi:hypothetical protein